MCVIILLNLICVVFGFMCATRGLKQVVLRVKVVMISPASVIRYAIIRHTHIYVFKHQQQVEVLRNIQNEMLMDPIKTILQIWWEKINKEKILRLRTFICLFVPIQPFYNSFATFKNVLDVNMQKEITKQFYMLLKK